MTVLYVLGAAILGVVLGGLIRITITPLKVPAEVEQHIAQLDYKCYLLHQMGSRMRGLLGAIYYSRESTLSTPSQAREVWSAMQQWDGITGEHK